MSSPHLPVGGLSTRAWFKYNERFGTLHAVPEGNRSSFMNHSVIGLVSFWCSSNPYYIVQQGQVKRITAMKDADRLGLLKEVAGTRVYEERRAESLKIMEDTDTKREQVWAAGIAAQRIRR